ncbi:MAG: dienelactone hydrolase family protein [Terriglobales bacterium]
MNCSDRVGTGASRACPERSRRVQAERSSAILCPRRLVAAVVAAIVSSIACLAAAQTSPAWRYDLRPGDHLIYRYSFHRQTETKDEQSQVDVRFRTHVLVTGENAGRISLGFQRNREAADLTQYISKGKDKLAHEQPDFQKRMQARPSRFSEAMEVSATGEPRYSWEIARETSSHIIDALHEAMTLPPVPLTKGETWRGTTMGFDLRWVEDESIHGKSCHHVEATSPKGSLKLSYWWSPESGVIEQIVLDGTYSNFDTTVRETARMELESRARREPLERWLGSPDTRLGALQSILLTPEVTVSAEQLDLLLSSLHSSHLSLDGASAQALALAIASRRKINIPPDVLHNLSQSSSTLIQAEVRQLTDSRSANTQPLVDECHRPLPPKSPRPKFGTAFEVAPPTKDTPEIPYLLRVPLSYHEDRPSPLLVYLSGGAGFAMDAMNSAEDIVSQTDYLVLYPQAAAYWWTPEVARRFDAVFNDVLQRYNVDRDRIYITGFSNGGTGALYYATLWPQRFAAVVTLMGAGQCNEQIKAGLGNIRNLPLLFVHGENDPIITPDCSTTTQDALNDLHPAVVPELKILPKHGHDITLQSDDGLTLAFFKDKIRNPFPRTVDLSETEALAKRAYWVEILDGKPGKSDIDARVKADNTIEIHSHNVKSIRLHLRPELLPKPGDLHIVWNGKKIFSGTLRDYCSLAPVSPSISTGDPKLDLADTRDLTLP